MNQTDIHSDPSAQAELMNGYLLGELSAEQLRSLEAALRNDPAVVDRFIETYETAAMIREAFRGDFAKTAIMNGGSETGDYQELLTSLEPAELLTPVDISLAMMDVDAASPDPGTLINDDDVAAALDAPRVIVIPKFVVYTLGIAVAAMLLFALNLMLFTGSQAGQSPQDVLTTAEAGASPARARVVVATLLSSEQAVWADGHQLNQGDLAFDQPYALLEGSATLKMHGGTLLRLEGPTTVEMQADDAVTLRSGKLLGYCDERAKGFVVTTEHGRFVDLGTAFGIIAGHDETDELHVFDGLVEASRLDASQQPIYVSTGEATYVGLNNGPLSTVPSDPMAFGATQPINLALQHGGQGLSEAQPFDTQWSLVEIDGQTLQRPLAAKLLIPASLDVHNQDRFLENDPDGSAWLTIPDSALGQDIKHFTFQRSIDLTGLSHATARVSLRIIADNFVSRVTVNDQIVYAIEDDPYYVPLQEFRTYQSFPLKHCFQEGVNVLKIEIGNHSPVSHKSPTGVRIELDGEALPAWYILQDPAREMN